MVSLLRFLFLVFVVLVIRWLFQRIAGVAAGPRGTRQGNPLREPGGAMKNLGKMVKDPVCGTYIDPSLAISLVRGGESIYFCSQGCRSQYEGRSGAAAG